MDTKQQERQEIKEVEKLRKIAMSQLPKTNDAYKGQGIKLAPSKARILNMEYPILLENNALILAKASSLSSSQRKYVINRVAFLLEKGKITQDEIDVSIEFINNLKNK